MIGPLLLRCIDPLGPQIGPSPILSLSRTQVQRLLDKAAAHRVLPIVLQNLSFPAGDEFQVLRHRAEEDRIEQLALSAMLHHHAIRMIKAAAGLPIAIVKGHVFAETIYPRAALRPFTDIDLLIEADAVTALEAVLGAQGFTKATSDQQRLEAKWIHSPTGALLEVHSNLVHSPRMRRAFSLRHADVMDKPLAASTQLAVAVTHGAMHYFAWLRHVVDVCQAARTLPIEEEARFQGILERTGTRVPALIGLALAAQLLGDARCSELARSLTKARESWVVGLLRDGAALTATSDSWIVYNSWRRYIFRELMRYGALKDQGDRGSNHGLS